MCFQKFGAFAHELKKSGNFALFPHGFFQASGKIVEAVGFVFVVVERHYDHALELLRTFFVGIIQEILFVYLTDVGEVDFPIEGIFQQLAGKWLVRVVGMEQQGIEAILDSRAPSAQ